MNRGKVNSKKKLIEKKEQKEKTTRRAYHAR
jgi:hypothetical protein